MYSQKKILIKLLFLFLPFTIIFFFLEHQLKTKPFVSSYSIKKKYLETQLDSIETLILGSSQAFNGIDPSCFSTKTFNIANVSQTLYYDKRLTLQYLPKLTKLKNVIINIGYFSFFYQLFDIKESWRDYYYLQHFGIKYYQLSNFSLTNYSAVLTYKIPHTFKLLLKNFKDETAIEILRNGYQPKFIQETISDSLGLKRVTLHNDENFKRRTEIEKDLEDFIKQLSNKKINIVFVTTPVFNTYSKFCNNKIIDTNNNFISSLCKKYNCKYLNYFSDLRFEKTDFFDNDHLKYNGAKKLSTLINDTLKK